MGVTTMCPIFDRLLGIRRFDKVTGALVAASAVVSGGAELDTSSPGIADDRVTRPAGSWTAGSRGSKIGDATGRSSFVCGDVG
ncbi:MAG: hypothetical protein ABJ382_06080, partial [Ilumatobacter sp.]